MSKKILLISTLLCFVILAGVLSVFAGGGVALAENSNVSIDIVNDSSFTAYGDAFALVTDNNVYVVKDSIVHKYTEEGQFTVLDMAMNSKYLVLLVTDDSGKNLYVYSYDSKGITKIKLENPNVYPEEIVALYNDNSSIFAMDSNKVYKIDVDSSSTLWSTFISKNPLYTQISDMAILNEDVLYFILDGNLYSTSSKNFTSDDLSSFLKLEGSYTDLVISGEKLILLDATKAYVYDDASNSTSELLSSGINEKSKLAATYISSSNTNYVYVKSDLPALNMYEFTGSALNYYNTFDRTIYTHPATYTILTMNKINAEATVYSSPRHLQKLATLSSDDYVILLSEVGDYYYIYFSKDDKKVNLGYIRKDSDITLCPASTECEIGAFAQALHPDTAVYKYPFVGDGMNDTGSEAVAYLTIYDQLVVIDNVGQDGTYKWGWYKIQYLNANNQIVEGYVKEKDVSPYTVLTPPDISKTVKVSSKKLGEYVKVYALPQEDSKLIAELKEGTSIDLHEKYDKNSEWTAVIYNDMIAYVKTENIQPGGLTSWQLALAITVPIVVVAIVVTVIILVVVKKRKYLSRM